MFLLWFYGFSPWSLFCYFYDSYVLLLTFPSTILQFPSFKLCHKKELTIKVPQPLITLSFTPKFISYLRLFVKKKLFLKSVYGVIGVILLKVFVLPCKSPTLQHPLNFSNNTSSRYLYHFTLMILEASHMQHKQIYVHINHYNFNIHFHNICPPRYTGWKTECW